MIRECIVLGILILALYIGTNEQIVDHTQINYISLAVVVLLFIVSAVLISVTDGGINPGDRQI